MLKASRGKQDGTAIHPVLAILPRVHMASPPSRDSLWLSVTKDLPVLSSSLETVGAIFSIDSDLQMTGIRLLKNVHGAKEIVRRIVLAVKSSEGSHGVREVVVRVWRWKRFV